jgi:integrase/recombinase XerD
MSMNTAPNVIDARPAGWRLTADHLTGFLHSLECTAGTIQSYGRCLKQLVEYFREHGIIEPTHDDLREYRHYLMSIRTPRTAQLYFTTARMFFSHLEDTGQYPNVARGIKGIKVNQNNHAKDYLTGYQVREILARVTDLRDRAMIMLMFTAGLRCCEVMRANIEDMRNMGNDAVLYVQGKGHDAKDELVKLEPHTHKAILAYLSTRTDQSGAAPLFTSNANRNRGQRMTTISISRIVKNSFIAAGYISDRWTAHSTRHTAATLNLLNGGTIQETQQLLRHASINTTLIYSHNLDRLQNESEARIADAIFGTD